MQLWVIENMETTLLRLAWMKRGRAALLQVLELKCMAAGKHVYEVYYNRTKHAGESLTLIERLICPYSLVASGERTGNVVREQ